MYAIENRIVNIDEIDTELKKENKLRSIKESQVHSLKNYNSLYAEAPTAGDKNYNCSDKLVYLAEINKILSHQNIVN